MNACGAALFLISLHTCLVAEDIVTKSGKVLKNAEIVAIDGGKATIQHAGGTEKLGATEVPESVQKRFRDQELKLKTGEVERLKEELARRETEVRKLKEENERLTREPNPAAPAPARIVENPSTPMEQLPEIKDGDVIEAGDVVLRYQTDATAAGRRFQKKTLQIKGVVERFEPKMFMRLYDVLLQSPEKSVGVVCKFSYADRWNTVYTKDRGRLLVAKEGRSEIQLLKAGEGVTIRARCEGLKGSDLVFSRCEIVR